MLSRFQHNKMICCRAMEEVSTCFINLFMHINATFSKDSSDCITTLSSAADFIQYLTTLPPAQSLQQLTCNTAIDDNSENVNSENKMTVETGYKPLRTYTMSQDEVRKVLGWPSIGQDDAGMANHPLNDLDVLLFEYAKDEDGLKAVHAGVHALITILKTPSLPDSRPEAVEVMLPDSDTLLEQLKRRTVYSLVEDDEEEQQLTSTYWLSTPMGDDFDHEPELTKCDLIQLVEKFVPGFDLEAELKKGSNMSETSILSRQIKRIASRKNTDTINTSKMTSGGAAFVAPLRGRGFIRGVMGGGLNRGDMFRSRPPNTSRPPSMHVDDFVKLETQTHHQQQQQHHQPPLHQQQGVSTATNVMPMQVGHLTRRSDEMMRLRGDPFDRGVTRFFSSTRWPFHTFHSSSSSSSRDDTVLLLRGAYRTVGVLNRPGLMMRGTATNLNNRTSPTKNIWPIRRSNYSTVAAFARSGSEVGERRPPAAGAAVAGASYAYPTQNPGIVWHEHKDRTHEHRINVPADAFSAWRERMHHPKSIR
ncbi:hypothetical protein HELRODRAFT_188559 [Helobdella robusta]|uniref:Uncharacterized protein n=1 Tax=Helobdella robusta TaxID=6412 RepID=T1FQ45_HELRO|nr:hypothetical protein HELRODRAFT_188559 [Helobdella robusta]ESO02054.1 hypothetical protein HELRODRAFT_188559 [Helobdella robusta]